jgi:hypothetical protein
MLGPLGTYCVQVPVTHGNAILLQIIMPGSTKQQGRTSHHQASQLGTEPSYSVQDVRDGNRTH